MQQTGWGYVALCLIAPLAWGVVSARVFDAIEARRERKRTTAAPNDLDESQEMYHI